MVRTKQTNSLHLGPPASMVRTKQIQSQKKTAPGTYEKFINNRAQDKYDRVFANKELWLEKGFAISNIASDMGLPPCVQSQIEARGWVEFCAQPEGTLPEIVKEFYANIADCKAWRVKVREIWVPIQSKDINSIYDLGDIECAYSEFVGNMEEETWDIILQKLTVENTQWTLSSYGQRSVKRSQLIPDAQIWYTFLSTRLMPTSHGTTVSQDRLALLYCILNGVPINVGQLIAEQLKLCVAKTKGKLFFPCLITALCAFEQVPGMEAEDYLRNSGTIRTATIASRSKNTTASSATPTSSKTATANRKSPGKVHVDAMQPEEHMETERVNVPTLPQLELLSHQQTALLQHIGDQQHTYMMYRQKYDKALKLTLKKNFPGGIKKFPKFPTQLLLPFTEKFEEASNAGKEHINEDVEVELIEDDEDDEATE